MLSATLTFGLVAAIVQAPAPAVNPPRVLLLSDPDDTTQALARLRGALITRLVEAGRYSVVLGPTSKRPNLDLEHYQEGLASAARGWGAFEDLDLEKALEHYRKAVHHFERAQRAVYTVYPLADSLLMLGACHLLLQQKDQARTLFRRALTIAPDHRPNEAAFNPQMNEVLENLRTELEIKPTLTLRVSGVPEGSVVHLNGGFAGLSPVAAQVPPGQHVVQLSRAGYLSSMRMVEIVPPHTTSVTLALPSLPSDAPRSMVLATLKQMDTPQLTTEMKTFMQSVDAEELVLFGLDQPQIVLLARYQKDGTIHVFRRITAPLENETEARLAARRLATWLPGAPTNDPNVAAAPVTLVPTEAVDVAAATDYWFSPHPGKEYSLWAAYGTAAVLAVAGGIFASLALSSQSEFDQEAIPGGQIDFSRTTDQVEGASIADSGRSRARTADILWSLSAAAALTGVGLHLFWDPRPTDIGKVQHAHMNPTVRIHP